jgi:hypothetical protein
LYVAYDGDEAGDRGSKTLRAMLPQSRRLRPPDGMDLTDLHRHTNGGLRDWLLRAMNG